MDCFLTRKLVQASDNKNVDGDGGTSRRDGMENLGGGTLRRDDSENLDRGTSKRDANATNTNYTRIMELNIYIDNVRADARFA